MTEDQLIELAKQIAANPECLDVTEPANEVEMDADDEIEMDAGDFDPADFNVDDDEDEEDEEDEYITDEDDDTAIPATGPITDTTGQMSAKPDGLVALRVPSLSAGEKPVIDRENRTIRNVAVMTEGPAKGHGFTIDKKMLQQTLGGWGDGQNINFTHQSAPNPNDPRFVVPKDSLGTKIGQLKNVRMGASGNQLRGDIQFGKYASNVPGKGDVASYLMDLADESPESFGLSVVFAADDFERHPLTGSPLGRVRSVMGCDIVGDPAANPRGLA